MTTEKKVKAKTYSDGFGTTLIVECNPPEWIKKATKNRKRRIKYYADKHGISIKKAEQILNDKSEDNAEDKEREDYIKSL